MAFVIRSDLRDSSESDPRIRAYSNGNIHTQPAKSPRGQYAFTREPLGLDGLGSNVSHLQASRDHSMNSNVEHISSHHLGMHANLIVHHQGFWFQAPGRALVHCRSRHAIRALLAILALNRRDDPGMPVPSEELRHAAWPGERMSPESARNRLKQSIRTLRSLGLEGIVLWKDGGYFLTTDVAIEIR